MSKDITELKNIFSDEDFTIDSWDKSNWHHISITRSSDYKQSIFVNGFKIYDSKDNWLQHKLRIFVNWWQKLRIKEKDLYGKKYE